MLIGWHMALLNSKTEIYYRQPKKNVKTNTVQNEPALKKAEISKLTLLQPVTKIKFRAPRKLILI